MAIQFQVGFRVDSKELTQGLAGIHSEIEKAFSMKSGFTSEIQKATQSAQILEKAMTKAMTTKGTSYLTLNRELQKAGTNAAKLTANLAGGGDKFVNSLNIANTALATANRSAITLNEKFTEMGRVFIQSFKFTAAQTAIRAISGELQAAKAWVIDLNAAVNNIGVVTGKTASQLEAITKQTVTGAKELRVAAREYAEAELIFYQQGLNDTEVQKRTEVTIKAAKAAGASVEDMSSQLTAIWNTYGMIGEEQERAASIGAKMAAQTAVDFADIAEAMQISASAASQMGVSYESLASIIATVGDVTQQSASVIGNAYKTIFSRFEQLKAEGTDGEVTLGQVSSQLAALGVNVLDSVGNLKELDTVIQEVGMGWDTFSSKQQLAIAELVGGTRQYGQFLALMQNFDKYQKNLASAKNEGTDSLTQQYEQALQSIESLADNSAEAWKRAFSNLIPEDLLKSIYQISEGIGNTIDAMLSSLGGLPGLLTIVATLLSSKIVPGLIQAGRDAKALFTNIMSPEWRQRNINAEFDANAAAIQRQQAAGTGDELYLKTAQLKNEFSRQTALINDQINTKLQTATGEYKLQLEYQQQLLESAQEIYQATLDQAAAAVKVTEQEEQAARRKANRRARQEDADPENATIRQQARDASAAADIRRVASSAAKAAASGGARTELKDLQKTTEEVARSLTQVSSTADQSSEAFNEMQSAIQAVEEAEEDLKNQEDDLNSALLRRQLAQEQLQSLQENGADEAVIEAAQGQLEGIEQEIADIEVRAVTYEEAVQRAALATAGFATELEDIGDGEETTAAAEAVDEMISHLQTLEEMRQRQANAEPSPAEKGPESLAIKNWGELASGIVQVGTAVMATTQAVSSLVDAFDADSPAEFLGALLSGAMSAIPAIKSLMDGMKMLNVAIGEGTLASISNALASKLDADGKIAEAVATGTATLAQKLLNAAIYEFPLMWIVGAIVAVISVLTIFSKISEKVKEAHKEEAKAAIEAAEATQAENEVLHESVETYEDALKVYDEAKEANEDVAEAHEKVDAAIDKVIEAMGGMESATEKTSGAVDEQSIALAKLTGNYEDLTKAIKAAESAQNESARVDNSIAQGKQGKVFEDAMREGVGRVTFGKYRADFGTDYSGTLGSKVGAKNEDGSAKYSAFNTTAQYDENGIPMGESLNIRTGSSVKEMQEAYEQGKELYRELISDSKTANQQVTQDLADWLAKSQEAYEALSELQETGKAVTLEALTSDPDSLSELYSGTNELLSLAQNTDTLEGFQAYKEKLVEIAEQADISETAVSAFLSSSSKFSDLNTVDLGLNELAEKTNFTKEQLQEMYNELNDEDKVLFWQIDFDENTTMKNYNAQLSELQANAKNAKLQIAIEATSNFKDNLKEQSEMSKEDFRTQQSDYAALSQNWKDAGLEGVKSYEQFLNMSYEKQKEYLDKMQKAAEDEAMAELEAKKKAIQEEIKLAEAAGNTKRVEELKEALSSVNTEIGLEKKARQAAQTAKAKEAESLKELNDLYKEGTINLQAYREGLNELAKEAESLTDLNRLLAEGLSSTEYGDMIAQLAGAGALDLTDVNQSMSEGKLTVEQYSEALRGLAENGQMTESELSNAWTNGLISLKDYTYALQSLAEAGHLALAELKDSFAEGFLNDVDYGHILVDIAQNYDNAIPAIHNYQDAVMNATNAQNDFRQAQEELRFAMHTGDEEFIEQNRLAAENAKANRDAADAARDLAEAQLNAAIVIGEAADKYDLATDELEDLAAMFQKIAKEKGLDLGAEEAAKAAVRYRRLNNAIDHLTNNWDDYEDAIAEVRGEMERGAKANEAVAKSSEATQKAMRNLRTQVAGLLDVEEELLDNDFLMKHMEDIESAADGNIEAIQRLQTAFAQDLAVKLGVEVDENEVQEAMDYLQSLADGAPIDFTADGDFTALMQKMFDAMVQAGMTASEIENAFAGMGIDCDVSPIIGSFEAAAAAAAASGDAIVSSMSFDAEPVTAEVQQTNTDTMPSWSSSVSWASSSSTSQVLAKSGEGYELTDKTQTIYTPTVTVTETPVPATETKETSVTGMKLSNAHKSAGGNISRKNQPISQGGGNAGHKNGGTGGGKGSGGGGGGGQAKTATASHQTSTRAGRKTRYETLKGNIERASNVVDKLNDNLDDAFGLTRLQAYNKVNNSLQQMAKNYQAIMKAAKNYYETDKANLESVINDDFNRLQILAGVSAIGVDLQFDSQTGELINWEEVTNAITEAKNEQIRKTNEQKAIIDAIYRQHLGDEDWKAEEGTAEYNAIKAAELAIEQLGLVDEEIADLEANILDTYEDFSEDVEEYREALKAQLQLIRDWMANKVAEAAYKMELRIGVSERDVKMLQRTIDLFGDLGNVIGVAVSKLNGVGTELKNQANAVFDNTDRMLEILKNIRPGSEYQQYFIDTFGEKAWNEYLDGNGALPESVIQQLEDNWDSLFDIEEEIWENQAAKWDSYMNAIETFIGEWDRLLEHVQNQESIADSWISIMEQTSEFAKMTKETIDGKDIYKANESYKNLLKQSLNYTKQRGDAIAGELTAQEQIATSMKAAMEELGDPESWTEADEDKAFEYNRYKEAYEEARSAVESLKVEMASTIEELYEKASQYAEAWAQQLTKEFSQSLDGMFSDLNTAMDMYSQKDTLDKFYMDDYDKEYELNKLARSINSYIKNSSTLDASTLKRYQELLDEIEERKVAGVKMTEKELEILREQFNLEQARDAYEDARNQKNTMRLARDASGNYSYIYSSDSATEAEDAQQKIEDALANIHKLHREAADEMGELWLQTQAELFQYEQEIDWALYERDEKYAAEVDQRREWYKQQLELYAKYFAYHNEAIGRNQEETTLGMIANTNNLEEKDAEYAEKHDNLVEELHQNYLEWFQYADTARQEITGSTETLADAIDTETKKMQEDYQATAKEIESLKNKNETYLSAMLNKTRSWAQETTQYYQIVIDKIREYQSLIKETVEEAAVGYDTNTNYMDLMATDVYKHFGTTNVSAEEIEAWMRENGYEAYRAQRDLAAADRGYEQLSLSEIASHIAADFASGQTYFYDNEWNYGGGTSKYADDTGYNTATDYSSVIKQVQQRSGLSVNDWLESEEGKRYVQERVEAYIARGGTAKGWGGAETYAEMKEWFREFLSTSSGGLISKPQIRSLAEEGPELVLNSEDTQNILDAVRNMRSIVNAQLGRASFQNFSDAIQNAKSASASQAGLTVQTPVQQGVQIDASFPNVTVAAEIEEALNSLVNQAVQYAAQK